MADESEKSKSEYRVIHEKDERNQKLKQGDDINNKTRRTLGDYVSAKSKEEKNKYTISPGSQRAQFDIDNSLAGADNPFVRTGQENSYALESQSGIFPNTSEIQNERGVVDSDVYKDGEDFVDKAVTRGLERSRFSPDARPSKMQTNWSPQTTLGSNNEGKDEFDFEEMSKIADAIMLKAAGHVGVTNNTLKNTFVALAPGATQLGGRISSDELDPTSIEGIESFDTTVSETFAGESQRTWGVVNSPAERYGDKTPAGMAALAIAMTVSLKLVVEGLSRIISLAKKDPYDKNTPVHLGPFPLGRRSGVETSDSFFKPREYLGIDNTEHSFASSLDKGIELFFDFSRGAFGRVAKQPGYYVGLIRSINQSGVEVVNDFTSLGDIKGTGLEVVESVASIVDGLRTNKIIAFINILAQMGDRALKIEDMGFDSTKSFSMLDSMQDSAVNRAAKVKSSKNTMQSTYRNSATKSSFLFPKSAMTSNRSLNGNMGAAIAGLSSGNTPLFLDGKNRIATEARKEVERELEAEYVPFYFHDLRTNEIISFHAFLEQLDDSYQTKWNESEVYGRVDPVGTYQSTKRTVNFAFKVVSTSKQDFDNMWFKINKLMTMLYPQWSKGRQVSAEVDGQTRSFVQPFSQVQSASPLIRLRVGDVISSNYSKFSLARTFGLGYSETNIVDIQSSSEEAEEYFAAAREIRERMEKNPADFEDNVGFRTGEFAFLNPNSFGGYPEVGAGSVLQRVRSLVPNTNSSKKKLVLTTETKVLITKSPKDDPSLIVSSGYKSVAYYHISVAGATSDEQQGNFIVSHSDLYPDSEQVSQLAAQKSNFSGQNPISSPDVKFFSSDENVIVKSFEEAGGRGLPGWIKSVSLQEMISNQVTWETAAFGSRAPKMVKFQMQFQPIHDIAPGIDEFGFSRAPQYNVGTISRNVSGVDDGESQDQIFNEQHTNNSNIFGNKSIKN